MTRGVRLYIVGSFVLVSLAGCGRGLFQSSEREPWRAEAEVACLKSGAVRENPDLVRINPISGPGACGAEFPLKVAALGESSSSLGFANDLRPPGSVGNAGPRWNSAPPVQRNSYPEVAVRQPGYDAGTNAPISLSAPGVGQAVDDDIAAELENDAPERGGSGGRNPYAQPATERPLPRLGPEPAPGNGGMSFGPVVMKPAATLACPIVSALDRWLAESVQPAAMRWFGSRVAEIKQISAYSCRGRNGDHSNRISEHAFGNALDIAAFVLSDGRRIVVETGWHGLSEEQAFLRDVQGSACGRFSTVLAPGSNAAHYNHIHVDLRKRSGRDICNPRAISGDELAARATGRYAARRGSEPSVTGSIAKRWLSKETHNHDDDD